LTHNGLNHFDAVLYKKSPIESNQNFFSFKATEKMVSVRSKSHEQVSDRPKSPPLPSLEQFTNAQPDFDTISLLSTNAASWEPHSQSLLASGADILVVQETRVSSVGMIQQDKFLAAQEQPWHAIWGKPPANPTNKFAMPEKRATGKTTYGGVGIISKKFLPLIPIGRDGHAAQVLYESTRWTTAAVPLSTHGALARRFLHICSFYGVVNRRNDARHTQNDRLLSQLLNYGMSLGQEPVILCLDSSTTIQASLVLNQAIASKHWIDLGAYFTKDSPEFTFSSDPAWDKISGGKGITRPDLILVNATALHMCKSFRLHRDLTVKGHLGLQVEISLSRAMEVFRVFRPPKPFLQLPEEPEKKAAKQKLRSSISQSFQKHFNRYSTTFNKAPLENNMNSAWTTMAKLGEAILADFSKQKGEGGRNRSPVFVQQAAVAASASAKHPDHVHKRALVSLHKLLRLLKELQFKQCLFHKGRLSATGLHDVVALTKHIYAHCQTWKLPCAQCWTDVQCQGLISQVNAMVQQHHKSAAICRIRVWKKKLRDSFELHKHGAAAFTWLNSKAPVNMQAISTPQGTIVTDTNEMLATIAQAWQDLFHENDLVNMDHVLTQIDPLLHSVPCVLQPLSGQDLKKQLAKTKSSRAVALDGWRIEELKFLPCEWYDLLAKCLNAIENGASWPRICCLGVITTIPKGSGASPDDVPSGQLVMADGLSTRPITNLSPIYTTYSSCRYTQMTEWREQWLTPCMAGARKHHEIYDISWALALNLEYHTICQKFVAGISLDRKKFFDFLQYEVGFHLLKKVGAPSGLIAATQNMYNQLRCQYKFKRATTDFFSKKHGFAQGDSFSLQVALAFMMAWTKFIQVNDGNALNLNTGSFLDDSHFYCSSDEPEQAATQICKSWQRSLQFDDIMCLVTNSNKSFFFSNSTHVIALINSEMSRLPSKNQLTRKDSFTLVGSVVTSLGQPDTHNRNQRVFATVEKLQKLRYAPLILIFGSVWREPYSKRRSLDQNWLNSPMVHWSHYAAE
jgi:exonuclease III